MRAESRSADAVQVDVEPMPEGPENPHNVGFVAKERILRTEQEAMRDGDLAKSRVWKIKNPNSINPLNGACCYQTAPFSCGNIELKSCILTYAELIMLMPQVCLWHGS